MRPHRLIFCSILIVSIMGAGCTALNPTYESTKGKADSGQIQQDGPVPMDRALPLPDRDPTCPAGLHRCGGKCVNLQADPMNCGQCGHPCGGGTVCKMGACCPPNMSNCGGICTDVFSDQNNCGKCGQGCKQDQECTGGMCCTKGHANCNGKCIDVANDLNNCGACGNKCPPAEKCDNSKCSGGGPTGNGCADGSDEQKFSKGMVGCSGRVRFSSRHTLCASGYRVCKAAEWVANRGNTGPSNHYWTNDDLRYNGNQNSCWVSATSGKQCSGGSEPMRVCAGKLDSKWNYCNWTDCGFGSAQPNQYFGGCQGNPTAGALCCPN